MIIRNVVNQCRWVVNELKKKPSLSQVLGFVGTKLKGLNPIRKRYRYALTLSADEASKQLAALAVKPKISIIMPVYKVELRWLKLAVNSVLTQYYTNWQLCIVDDGSQSQQIAKYLAELSKVEPKVSLKINRKNEGISSASNEAIALAKGEYITFLDNDDELTQDALLQVVKCINQSSADLIYSDEDSINLRGRYVRPHFKPDFSPDLLRSHNYITHLLVVKRQLLDSVGYFDQQCDGAQDYDLVLRVAFAAKCVEHISKVLYHWRDVSSSVSRDAASMEKTLPAGKIALEKYIERKKISATVEDGLRQYFFRVRYEIIGSPLVSIIIPFKDKPELLRRCVNSILEKTDYPHYEILLVSNNSESDGTFALMEHFETKDKRIRLLEYNLPFNYSAINNYAVNFAKGEHLLLLNNDTEVISKEWLRSMLEHSQRAEVGCVGAKLYYGDTKRIQHAGVVLGMGGVAGHIFKNYKRNAHGYFGRLKAIQNYSAVTGACLMVKKSIYQSLDGLNEINLKVAFNDVDFCLRLMDKGYRNVWTPYAELYHHESISRGYENTAEKIERFNQETAYMKSMWKNKLTNDVLTINS